tara:strand:- start:8221 stop:8352 length:132 start_codon:yes stop_codon:yes gene_type:complete
MNSEELIEELQFSDKWLTDEYKQSPYYREYLVLIFKDLEKNYT